MNRLAHDARLGLMLLAALVAAPPTWAADSVRLTGGGSMNGTITAVSRDALSVEGMTGRTEKAPVTNIKTVLFEAEPPQLTQARINAANGGYETALEKLSEISGGAAASEFIQQDIAFYTAYCEAKLAIAGAYDVQKAGRRLNAFLRDNRQSYHFYPSVETLGDLYAKIGRHAQAEKMYAQIAKAPYASLKARAALLAGRSLHSRGEPGEAVRRFDAVLALPTEDDGTAAVQLEARLAKALSLAATDRLEEGLDLAREVVRQAGEADVALNAAAYNTLGRCYEVGGRPKDALFAYLHTDLLFNGDPATHAEALSQLVELWRTAGKPDEARDALARLRRRYAASTQARESG